MDGLHRPRRGAGPGGGGDGRSLLQPGRHLRRGLLRAARRGGRALSGRRDRERRSLRARSRTRLVGRGRNRVVGARNPRASSPGDGLGASGRAVRGRLALRDGDTRAARGLFADRPSRRRALSAGLGGRRLHAASERSRHPRPRGSGGPALSTRSGRTIRTPRGPRRPGSTSRGWPTRSTTSRWPPTPRSGGGTARGSSGRSRSRSGSWFFSRTTSGSGCPLPGRRGVHRTPPPRNVGIAHSCPSIMRSLDDSLTL